MTSTGLLGPHGVILSLCPTGMVPDRALTPHVPLTPLEIADDVLACASLGVSMVHLHARDEAGRPHYAREIYARQIAAIRAERPDLVLCVSLSGRTFTTFEARADPLALEGDLRPDMGSLTLGSLNFINQASVNSPDMVRRLAEAMGEKGIKPELEVFDLGMVNVAHHLVAKGALQPPFYFNLLLGNLASAQATPAALAALLSELPQPAVWCVAGLGRHQLLANTLGLLLGDGARVGLEDNIWFDAGHSTLATNPGLVQRLAAIAAQLGRPLATPAEVRARLALPRQAAPSSS